MKVVAAEGVSAATTAIDLKSVRDRFDSEGRDKLAKFFAANLKSRLRTIRRLTGTDEQRVVLGTDTPQLSPREAFHGEVDLLRGAGLTPAQVIQAATRNAAAHLGREETLGTLERGKLADLIVVDGNPLEDLSTLEEPSVVIKGGAVVAGRPNEKGESGR